MTKVISSTSCRSCVVRGEVARAAVASSARGGPMSAPALALASAVSGGCWPRLSRMASSSW
eukprot:5694629-Alexandrium_andersonii.AAC.1